MATKEESLEKLAHLMNAAVALHQAVLELSKLQQYLVRYKRVGQTLEEVGSSLSLLFKEMVETDITALGLKMAHRRHYSDWYHPYAVLDVSFAGKSFRIPVPRINEWDEEALSERVMMFTKYTRLERLEFLMNSLELGVDTPTWATESELYEARALMNPPKDTRPCVNT